MRRRACRIPLPGGRFRFPAPRPYLDGELPQPVRELVRAVAERGPEASRILLRRLVAAWPGAHRREAAAFVRGLLVGLDAATGEAAAAGRAGCDPVSGLPPVHPFAEELLPRLLLRHRRDGRRLALLDVDVAGLGGINREYGRVVGDAVLREVAARLRALVRAQDAVLRQPGDRFLCVLPGLDGAEAAAAVARRIGAAMRAPVVVGGRKIPVRLRVGVAVFPDHARDAAALLQAAESALEAAERPDGWCLFSPDLAMRGPSHRLLAELEEAIGGEGLVLHFQPQVDLATGAPAGVEALVRWRHPVRGLVPPAVFVEAAERGGLAVPLGERVLDLALSTLARLRAAGLPVRRCAVNLGTGMVRRPELAAFVLERLRRHRLPPAALELEITEGVLLEDRDGTVREWMEALHARGVTIALDDFGTGYASLAHLGRFPVDRLKIDRSFVLDLGRSARADAVVRAVLGLACGLGLEVVAEGVETEDQRRALLAHGCRLAQGHLFAPPLPEAELVAFLRTAPVAAGAERLTRTRECDGRSGSGALHIPCVREKP